VIANVIGMAGVAHRNAYVCGTAANAALIAFTNAVGSSSSHQGVRVFGVNPGHTRSERIISLEKNTPGALSSGVAFGRPMEPSEVADFIVFGCSTKASYLSGTVINLDGGQQYAGQKT
jgi:NAD(P)-dependent dehydrogenase (short-subunit alcohol dehydrogenase family)